jgi:hypothetical protein
LEKIEDRVGRDSAAICMMNCSHIAGTIIQRLDNSIAKKKRNREGEKEKGKIEIL